MTTATFDPAGGPIVVAVSCTPNRNGSYDIILWEAKTVVKKYSGDFTDASNDSYNLDTPNSSQNGRLLEAMAVVAIPAGVGPSDVTMTVSQGGTELAHETQSVPPGSAGQLVDLSITLASK